MCHEIFISIDGGIQDSFMIPKGKYFRETIELNDGDEEPFAETEEENYYGCPNCRTDSYLTNVTSEKELL